MSTNPDDSAPEMTGEKIATHPKSQDATKPMGWTSENVAGDFAITREAQDEFASSLFQKAAEEKAAGWFADEIVTLETLWKDPESEIREIVVSSDDRIRPETSSQP